MRNAHCRSWNMGINLKNVENEIKTLYPGIWPETLNILENENCTLQDLEYGQKPGKCEK